ncbi:velvet complex subunit B-like [Salvelinus namaycush]|uniref:Velvet complex subunit B-like n=1 Tax=Salvelinus namaycush TaxID=8040 RepID=A0A8U0U666_SALNM|nr:velvet complex subunit B-like [Salvelinus namaycush]
MNPPSTPYHYITNHTEPTLGAPYQLRHTLTMNPPSTPCQLRHHHNDPPRPPTSYVTHHNEPTLDPLPATYVTHHHEPPLDPLNQLTSHTTRTPPSTHATSCVTPTLKTTLDPPTSYVITTLNQPSTPTSYITPH